MAVGVNDVVAQMRQALALSDPDLDTTVGTTVRKILDAVGEVVAESYLDRYILDYQYDIDSKSGADLDDFVALFGFSRLASRRATGTVTFERSGSDSTVVIGVGTQMATDDSYPVTVQTVVPAMMLRGDTSITVPAQALLGGAGGNIPANSLRIRVTNFDGVGSFTNLTAFTGGADPESDEQLRLRFKRTIFRNLAGTEQMFTAVALEDEAVTQVNVIGASKRRREQIQITGGTATSTLVGARYVYPGSSVFGVNIDGGEILTPGVHYTFDPTTPPSITSVGTSVPDGIYDFEYEYVPAASRNDPTGGVTNRVDVYVNGDREIEAVETAAFRSTKVFNNTAGDPLNRANFLRNDASQPQAGNFFLPLSFAPVTDVPDDAIMFPAGWFLEDIDFWVVNDITREGGTSRSLSGIEIRSPANGEGWAIPPDGTPLSIGYSFNAVPRDVEEAVRAWRLITTDVRVHQAKPILLDIYLAVMLTPGLSLATVQPAMDAALGQYISTVGFGGVVQVSDLVEVAHQVNGVDAVRLLTSTDDATHYAIQRVSGTGTTLQTYATGGRAADVYIGDDEVPALNSVTLVQRAQNTFGIV